MTLWKTIVSPMLKDLRMCVHCLAVVTKYGCIIRTPQSCFFPGDTLMPWQQHSTFFMLDRQLDSGQPAVHFPNIE